MLVNTNSVIDMVDLNICMYVHSIIYVHTKQGYFLINLVTCIMKNLPFSSIECTPQGQQ